MQCPQCESDLMNIEAVPIHTDGEEEFCVLPEVDYLEKDISEYVRIGFVGLCPSCERDYEIPESEYEGSDSMMRDVYTLLSN